MICNKNHRYLQVYNTLPDAQDNNKGGRHICAGCAYEQGLKDGLNGLPPKADLSDLPYSQAGTVRRKDAREAYNEGYLEGKRRNS